MTNLTRVLSVLVAVCLSFVTAHAQQPAAAGLAAPKLTAQQLDKLLSPIALYPDALLIRIVQCATSPYQVKQVDAWLKQIPDLKGAVAQDAAAKQSFEADFVAIVLFPQVVHMMASQPGWTQNLGQAFATRRDNLLACAQRLPREAHSAGNFATNEQQSVQTVQADVGDTVIIIQPANHVYNPDSNWRIVEWRIVRPE